MSGFCYKNNILIASNHKCGSTALDNIFSPLFLVKGMVNNGHQFDYSFLSERYANLSATPWKHAHPDVWLKYLELKGIQKLPEIITTVRNPWDRMVSLYHYDSIYKTRHNPTSFNDFVKKFCEKTDSYDHFVEFAVTRSGRRVADHVLKLECLEEDLLKLFKEKNITLNINIDKGNQATINSSNRDRDYRKYYVAETIDLVASFFSHEIVEFDYKFE